MDHAVRMEVAQLCVPDIVTRANSVTIISRSVRACRILIASTVNVVRGALRVMGYPVVVH